jgi:hypothetical protein
MVALGALAALAVTACAGSTHPGAASARPAGHTAALASSATCAQAGGIIQDLANAQATLDASQQTEKDDAAYLGWLSLSAAIIKAGGPDAHWSPAGSGQLNQDLYQFLADYNSLMKKNYSMLTAVDSDITALATDCSITGTPSGSDSPSDSPAAPTMTKQTDVIVFRVQGSGYPSIQYGTDSSKNQATGGNGPLGDGSALPWTAQMAYDPSALYYAVTAQLEGSGSITDSVTEVVTTWCSDGTHQTESFPLAHGSASGGYTIASAQYNGLGGATGNADQAESDAGC